MRLLLNPAVTGQAVTPEQALAVHKQVTDWHLLNLAARHDGLLVTFDRKIARATLPADAARIITLGK